jgi:hypothetical protein
MLAALFELGIPILSVAGAVAAAIYAPPGFKRIAVEAVILLGAVSFIYGLGRSHADAGCKLKLTEIHAAQDAAIIAAEERVRAKMERDQKILKSAIEGLQKQAAADRAEEAETRQAIDRAPADADKPASPVLLRAVRGK